MKMGWIFCSIKIFCVLKMHRPLILIMMGKKVETMMSDKGPIVRKKSMWAVADFLIKTD